LQPKTFLGWNAATLSGGKVHSLEHLLSEESVDIAVISEVEQSQEDNFYFNIKGYASITPLISKGSKVRLMMFIKNSFDYTLSDLMETDIPSIWVHINGLLIGGIYRQFSMGSSRGTEFESAQLELLGEQLIAASEVSKDVLLLGDFNLDVSRTEDPNYYRKNMLERFQTFQHASGLQRFDTPNTFESYGAHKGRHYTSTLDHVYASESIFNKTTVKVLADAASDHQPLLAMTTGSTASPTSSTINRRKFGLINDINFEEALQRWDWDKVHTVEWTPSSLLDHISRGITLAMDTIAPLETIRVRPGKVLLSQATRSAMKKRDQARAEGNRGRYRFLRNRCSALVKKEKILSNLKKLSGPNPAAAAWSVCKDIMGKGPTPLPQLVPDADSTAEGEGSRCNSASVANRYYIKKIEEIRANLPPPKYLPHSRPAEDTLTLRPVSAGKVAKIIRGLHSSRALGHDGIPVDVLKAGVDTLASPLAKLVNLSILSGLVPSSFKKAIIRPIHKGAGKPKVQPSSYRPIAILPAMSKVLEAVVKEQLTDHLTLVEALPQNQHGFRQGRSTTTAIASSHGQWVKLRQRYKFVGVIAYDLSSAFDTLDPSVLLDSLNNIGVRGLSLEWFRSYLDGGLQQVKWNEEVSGVLQVLFGVRQGSLLGPILFSIVGRDSHAPAVLTEDSSAYADDTISWAGADTLEELVSTLEARAARFAELVSGLGLALNPAKTQFFIAANTIQKASIRILNHTIPAVGVLELLGVTIDHHLTFKPHNIKVTISLQQRAGLIRCLRHYIPRGQLLNQIASGLSLGKLQADLAVTSTPRFSDEDKTSSTAAAQQVALNDTARALTGCRRKDHIPIQTLLYKAGLESVNRLAVRATAVEAWKALKSGDGPGGVQNPLGVLLFEGQETGTTTTTTRAVSSGLFRLPPPSRSAYLSRAGLKALNMSKDLREATSIGMAKSAARRLARACPL
jgi:hypothetical protein